MGMARPAAANLSTNDDATRKRHGDGTHAQEITERLSRATGQLRGIGDMYSGGRWCADVLDQLAAVRRAIDGVALLVVEDHVRGCLTHNADGADMDELVNVLRRYVKTR